VRWASNSGALAVTLTLTLAAGLVVLVAPDEAGLVAHVWLAVVLAIAVVVALGRLDQAMPRRPSAFDAAFGRRTSEPARPASLARVEREVTLSTGTAFDVHYRLRPLLRGLAAGLLLRRGVDLDRSPERARAQLAPDVWELVRPDRPPPENRTAPGLSLPSIERAADDLERIA
jgi:hypothetical protein